MTEQKKKVINIDDVEAVIEWCGMATYPHDHKEYQRGMQDCSDVVKNKLTALIATATEQPEPKVFSITCASCGWTNCTCKPPAPTEPQVPLSVVDEVLAVRNAESVNEDSSYEHGWKVAVDAIEYDFRKALAQYRPAPDANYMAIDPADMAKLGKGEWKRKPDASCTCPNPERPEDNCPAWHEVGPGHEKHPAPDAAKPVCESLPIKPSSICQQCGKPRYLRYCNCPDCPPAKPACATCNDTKQLGPNNKHLLPTGHRCPDCTPYISKPASPERSRGPDEPVIPLEAGLEAGPTVAQRAAWYAHLLSSGGPFADDVVIDIAKCLSGESDDSVRQWLRDKGGE